MPSKADVDVGGWTDDSNQMERLPPIGYPAKSLMLLPHRLAIALQEDGWIVRAFIIWNKPAPMPESVTDRPTTAHEYIVLLTKQGRYFYDADAVREPAQDWGGRDRSKWKYAASQNGPGSSIGDGHRGATRGDFAATGRNLRSVWAMNTQSFPDAHYAVFPEELPRRCILAGTSERGCCPECGAPWKRVVERTGHVGRREPAHVPNNEPTKIDSTGWAPTTRATDSWRPTCDHGSRDPVPCTVLDPFAGTGTTLKVSKALGRHGVGIELSADYCEMAVKRLPQMAMALNQTLLPKR